VIVGGGLAGLAAASTLAGRGLQLTLLESRPRLGGRASSFQDPVTGEAVDNCQHVSMACCTNLADFCRRVGIANLFRREPALTFLSPDGKLSRMKAGLLPAPFHLAESFLRANHLSRRDKLQVARGLARLAFRRDEHPGETFADWLLRHGQGLRAINLFWAPVLVSALNARLDRMDVGHARKVLVDGFLKTRTGFQIEIPLVPLGELYGARLESWLQEHDVAARLKTGVRSVDFDDEGDLRGVVLRSGESIAADFVILAVPFDRLTDLLPAHALERVPELNRLEELETSPITGIHLWFDRPVCPFDHVVTPGRLVQWIFNHTSIQGRQAPARDPNSNRDAPQGQYLQLVISASDDLLGWDKASIRDLALRDLESIWPAVREAKLLRWWVVTEHGATFAVRPGIEAIRPCQRTPIDGLFLAGDWTDTGWPATMEGAVRSGYAASQAILTDLESPTRLLIPESKPGRLARLLLG
jgi:squalene-associated FAD-dependent desaturase